MKTNDKTHQKNRLAWEEAFNNQSESFKNDTLFKLNENPKLLFTPKLSSHLEAVAQKGGVIAQFCSNNGRETMAALAYGFEESVGFDIASNMVDFANKTAKTLNLKASFIQTDILEIDQSQASKYDAALITVGALCWFKHLDPFFEVVSMCLKPGAFLIIEESHPFTNCLAAEGEVEFDAKNPLRFAHDYFKSTPWVENTGMGYMTNAQYESLTFESYSHTLSELLNALSKHHFELIEFTESDQDQGNLFDDLNESGLPLTMNILARKK